VTIALAALSSLLWGTADFIGGDSTRRLPVLVVTVTAQLAGLATAALVLVISGEPLSAAGWAWGLAAGAVGCLALIVFYRALASGVMSLVAPVSAVGGVIPIAVALAGDADATALGLAGMAIALLGAAGCALAPGHVVLSREAIVLAVSAAVGIGLLLTLLGEAARADGSSGLGAVFAARVAGASVTTIAFLARRRGMPVQRSALLIVPLVGVLDTAANAAFAVASEDVAKAALVALLGSLYPLATLVLARLILHERLAALQGLAAVAAIGGAALASAA
jgi:drug/metabolite transporter (DMT)-like permease